MALFETSRIGHEFALKSLNPRHLMNMAAQAEAKWMFLEKRPHTVAATPESQEWPVMDTPGRRTSSLVS